MAILMRGGAYADFDPSKLRPREWAVVLENDPSARDGKAIYICFAAGMVKRISTYEDMKDDLISATEDIKEQYIQALDEIKNEVERLANEAEGFKDTAQAKAEEASNSAQVATQKSESASISAANAANNADLSEEYSRYSESYAVGTNGEVRPNDETDSSKYYKEECQRLYQVIERLIASVSSGGLIAAGTIPFEELPEEPQINYMYNISNDFVSDERFADGPGISYSKGTNVYWNADGKWDVLTGASVLGVKGENETEYQMGYVNITKESLGLDGLKQVAFSGSYNDLSDIPSSENNFEINYIKRNNVEISENILRVYTEDGASGTLQMNGFCRIFNYSDGSSRIMASFRIPVKNADGKFYNALEASFEFPEDYIKQYTDTAVSENPPFFPTQAYVYMGVHNRSIAYGEVCLVKTAAAAKKRMEIKIYGFENALRQFLSNESLVYIYIESYIK